MNVFITEDEHVNGAVSEERILPEKGAVRHWRVEVRRRRCNNLENSGELARITVLCAQCGGGNGAEQCELEEEEEVESVKRRRAPPLPYL